MKHLRQYIRRLLLEGPDSPQVIFMAGGPGSGKSTVIRSLGLAKRLEIVNPDDAYEAGLKAEGLPFDREKILNDYTPLKKEYLAAIESGDNATAAELEPEYLRLRGILSRNMQLFAKARKDAKVKQTGLMEAGAEFLVDGTGGNYKEIIGWAEKLKSVGYDVGMIYIDVPMKTSIARDQARGERGGRRLGARTVEKSWTSVNKNRAPYEQYFGNSFFYIDASENNFRISIEEIAPAVGRWLG